MKSKHFRLQNNSNQGAAQLPLKGITFNATSQQKLGYKKTYIRIFFGLVVIFFKEQKNQNSTRKPKLPNLKTKLNIVTFMEMDKNLKVIFCC